MPAALRPKLTKMWAEGNHSSHGFLAWIQAQISPLTCDEERLPDWAALYDVPRLDATFAVGFVMATGTAGTQILDETEVRGPNGLDYIVVGTAELTGAPTPVALRCLTAGPAGNLIAGQKLTLIDPVPGADSDLVIDVDGLTGGEDQELVDDWRARVAEEWQTMVSVGARSGKPDDYRFWAKGAHPSVTGALVQLHPLGKGTLIVRPICDGLDGRLPTVAVLEAVEAYLLVIAPACADWRVVSPIRRDVDVALHLLPGYDTAENRAAINDAIAAAVLEEGTDNAVLQMAELDVAIATVTSQYDRLAPLANVAAEAGEVLVFNSLVWS